MKCYVYQRVERVFYVVGTTGTNAAEAFADVLYGVDAKTYTGACRDKPFRSMNAREVMYVERVGVVSVHTSSKKLMKKSMRRAELLNALHADVDLELEPKKRRKK